MQIEKRFANDSSQSLGRIIHNCYPREGWKQGIKSITFDRGKTYTSVLFENAGLSLHKLYLNQDLIEDASYLDNWMSDFQFSYKIALQPQ